MCCMGPMCWWHRLWGQEKKPLYRVCLILWYKKLHLGLQATRSFNSGSPGSFTFSNQLLEAGGVGSSLSLEEHVPENSHAVCPNAAAQTQDCPALEPRVWLPGSLPISGQAFTTSFEGNTQHRKGGLHVCCIKTDVMLKEQLNCFRVVC